MALASSSRNGARIIWVALHTAEGSRRRSDLYNFFDTIRSGSSHGAADGTGLDDGWVPDDRSAWTLLNGNPVSLNLEMCAFARWTREQWLSTGTVDGVVNPRQMVRNAAEWARRKCEKYGIPKSHIGIDGVAARRPGIIMHRDYTYGAGDGDHTDIGLNFPWDVFFADMNGTDSGAISPEEDDMPLLVKGNKSTKVFAVSSTADGYWKRHIEVGEYNLLIASGVKVHEHNQWDVDAIPTRSGTAMAVANYDIPNGEGGFSALHQVLDKIAANTTSPPAP